MTQQEAEEQAKRRGEGSGYAKVMEAPDGEAWYTVGWVLVLRNEAHLFFGKGRSWEEALQDADSRAAAA